MCKQARDQEQENRRRRCRRCGRMPAEKFGDQWFCRECFQQFGSCCLEFGGDDLWRQRDDELDK